MIFKDYMKNRSNPRKWIMAILLGFGINGCMGRHFTSSGISKEVNLAEFRSLEVGMNQNEIIKYLKTNPNRKFIIVNKEDSITVLKYIANIGFDGSEGTILDLMYLSLKKDSLVYWGLPKKYFMSEDSSKKELMLEVMKMDSLDYKNFHYDTIPYFKYTPGGLPPIHNIPKMPNVKF
jgi:hypothetical protein